VLQSPEAPDAATPWLGRPTSLGDAFVGRETELTEYSADLAKGPCVVLCGVPGSGKSRLAAELAHRWEALGIDVKDKDDAAIAGHVSRLLAAEPPGTLVVLDNVPDLAQTNDLLTAGG
jgi:hypothetical protein